nr:MAG TPA: hypothetical protein [Bacteriophage sp.]
MLTRFIVVSPLFISHINFNTTKLIIFSVITKHFLSFLFAFRVFKTL